MYWLLFFSTYVLVEAEHYRNHLQRVECCMLYPTESTTVPILPSNLSHYLLYLFSTLYYLLCCNDYQLHRRPSDRMFRPGKRKTFKNPSFLRPNPSEHHRRLVVIRYWESLLVPPFHSPHSIPSLSCPSSFLQTDRHPFNWPCRITYSYRSYIQVMRNI